MNDQVYIKTLEIAGFVSALRAMRLPMKSGEKSDSSCCVELPNVYSNELYNYIVASISNAAIGNADLQLLQKLIRNGDEHSKCTRGINVWFEINAPRYFHVELDTYKIGAERLSSESTMHIECKNLKSKELQQRKCEIKESHWQKRIWMMSYQTLRRVYFQRNSHHLPEWTIFCNWIETLPLANELITINHWWQDKIETQENAIDEYECEILNLKDEIHQLKDEIKTIKGE